jgi:hypothetical protein
MRFYIVSTSHGLVATTNDEQGASDLALMVAVNTGHTVHLHDRRYEIGV